MNLLDELVVTAKVKTARDSDRPPSRWTYIVTQREVYVCIPDEDAATVKRIFVRQLLVNEELWDALVLQANGYSYLPDSLAHAFILLVAPESPVRTLPIRFGKSMVPGAWN